MLPFPKRRAQDDEVELEDEDLVLLDVEAPSPEPSAAERYARDAELAQTVQRTPRKHAVPPGSRRILDENIEEDVAGQCLASIAAETSRDVDLSSSSHIRAALARPVAPATPPSSLLAPPPAIPISVPALLSAVPASAPSVPGSTSRLPSVTAPPFVRTTTVPLRGHAEVPGVRESTPASAFVRRSSPVLPVAAPSSFAALTRATADAPSERNASSVAPVSVSQRPNEPTVIVLRERPKAAWILAAAAIGALGAIVGTRLLGHAEERALPAVAAAAPLAAPPSTALVIPAATAAAALAPATAAAPSSTAAAVVSAVVAPSHAPSANVMRFADDQGVAIKAPAAAAPAAPVAPAARPAARPARPSTRLGPALPDGSFGLGRSDGAAGAGASTTTAAAPSPPPAPAPAAPEPARRRALTPEQQLAEAQLKASMK